MTKVQVVLHCTLLVEVLQSTCKQYMLESVKGDISSRDIFIHILLHLEATGRKEKEEGNICCLYIDLKQCHLMDSSFIISISFYSSLLFYFFCYI